MITLKLSSVNRVLEHAVFKLFEHKGYSLVLKFYLYDVICLIIFNLITMNKFTSNLFL